MSKKKEEKDLKKINKNPKKYLKFMGNDLIVKKLSVNPPRRCFEINHIDHGLTVSYDGIIHQKYGKNQKSAVSKSHRDHILVVPPVGDATYKYVRRTDPDRIWEYMCIIRTMLENGNLTHSIPSYEPAYKRGEDDEDNEFNEITIEQHPEKPIGYYRLTKDSDTFPGLSRMLSNYIIDEVAAVVRMNKFSYDFDRSKSFIMNSSMHMIPGYSSYNLDDLKQKDPEFYKELDIRTCYLGDIETSINTDSPVLCFLLGRGYMEAYHYLENGYKGLSPYFGIELAVVTNPDAFFYYPETKKELFRPI